MPSTRIWTKLSPTGTAPGAGYPVVWDTVGKRLLVVDSSGNVTAYSPTTNAWAALTTGTTKPSNNLGVAWDSTDGIVLQFGGGRSCNNGNCNDLWAYSPVAGTWTQLTATNPPGLRSNEQLVWDSVHNQLLVVDGSSYINGISTYYDDVWAYSVAQSRWQQLTVSGTHPAARWYADLVFDPTDDIALLFGGSSSTQLPWRSVGLSANGSYSADRADLGRPKRLEPCSNHYQPSRPLRWRLGLGSHRQGPPRLRRQWLWYRLPQRHVGLQPGGQHLEPAPARLRVADDELRLLRPWRLG